MKTNRKECNKYAGVAELADARDSKSRGAICAGSSPATGTRLSLDAIRVRTLFFCLNEEARVGSGIFFVA